MKLSRWLSVLVASCLMTIPAFAQTADEQKFSRVELAMAMDVVEDVLTNMQQHEEAQKLTATEQKIIDSLNSFLEKMNKFAEEQPQLTEQDLQNMDFDDFMNKNIKLSEEISKKTEAAAQELTPLFLQAQTKYTEGQINKKAVTYVIKDQLQQLLLAAQMQQIFNAFDSDEETD